MPAYALWLLTQAQLQCTWPKFYFALLVSKVSLFSLVQTFCYFCLRAFNNLRGAGATRAAAISSLYSLQPSRNTSWPPGTCLNSPCFGFHVHLLFSPFKCGCPIIICEEHKAPSWGFKKTCVASNKPPFINDKLHNNAVKKNAVPLAAHAFIRAGQDLFYSSIYSRDRSCLLKCGRASATPILTPRLTPRGTSRMECPRLCATSPRRKVNSHDNDKVHDSGIIFIKWASLSWTEEVEKQ